MARGDMGEATAVTAIVEVKGREKSVEGVLEMK